MKELKLSFGIILGLLVIIFMIWFLFWVVNNGMEEYYKTSFSEMSYTGVLYDIQITDSNLVIVFNDGFYLSFQDPWDSLFDHFPFVDNINSGYSDLIILKNQSIEIKYVHCSAFGGSNYFGDVIEG